MNLRHAQRFATREAHRIAGELYPGPVLMPRGLLRALDPAIAVALGPALRPREAFHLAFEQMLRGRPDGPLLLTLWSSSTAGEIERKDLRALLELMPKPIPERPRSRAELMTFLQPRAELLARYALALAQRDSAEARIPATQLGCGLALTRLITDLPQHLTEGYVRLPADDLERAGATSEDLLAGIRTPAVNRFLEIECAWARELLHEGQTVCDEVGARLRRGLRAAILRADALLTRIENPKWDLFRRPVRLHYRERVACALRAWWKLAPLGGRATTP